jgi:hypothetical protein
VNSQASSVSVSNEGCGLTKNFIGITELTITIQIIRFAIVVFVYETRGDDRPFVWADTIGIFSNFSQTCGLNQIGIGASILVKSKIVGTTSSTG